MSLPKYISANTDRHGKTRLRFRRAGATAYIRAPLGSGEFWKEYAALLDGAKPGPKARKLDTESLEWLIGEFMESLEFSKLAPNTQSNKRRIYRRMIDDAGKRHFRAVTKLIVRENLRKRAAKPSAAKHWLKALSSLFNFAVEQGLIDENPCHGIKAPKEANEPHKAWTDDMVERYRQTHPLGTAARVLFDILAETGLRISDARTLGKQHIKGDQIEVRQQKTSAVVYIKASPALIESLAAMPKSRLTFCGKADGQPYSEKSVGMRFREWCKRAAIPDGFSAHGLRHRRGVLLAEAGATELEIQAALGHSSPNEARTYVQQASRRKLASRSAARLANCPTPAKVGQNGR